MSISFCTLSESAVEEWKKEAYIASDLQDIDSDLQDIASNMQDVASDVQDVASDVQGSEEIVMQEEEPGPADSQGEIVLMSISLSPL